MKRQPKLFHGLIKVIFLSVTVSMVISGISITHSLFQFTLKERGNSGIEVLKQVSDANNLNRVHMQNIISAIEDELSSPMVSDDDIAIQRFLEEIQTTFDRFQLDYSVDVILKDRRTFSSRPDSSTRLQYMISSYWYIKQRSGESRNSWKLSYLEPDDITSYALLCSQTIFDASDNPVGIIILNSTQESLFRTYQQLVKEGEYVYILDENGIVISHSNQSMIGQWFKAMDAFEKSPGYDSYSYKFYGSKPFLVANYHDPASGWTFVEEYDISPVLTSFQRTLFLDLSIILGGGLIAGFLGYRFAKKASSALTEMTKEVSGMHSDHLEPIRISRAYYEVETLSTAFNHLIRRLCELIQDIRLREAEKRKTEYDFLQAQMNPHFLHNTLIAVKSLIYIGETDKARNMLEQFVEFLDIPKSSDIPFVTLDEELHLVKSYLAVMNCRTDKKVALDDAVPPRFRNRLIPRMLLIPLVGNACFHGFAEKEEDCRIRIEAEVREQKLFIRVRDNGEGIDEERLRQISGNDYSSDGLHHGIGIKNVRKRLQYIYGGDSSVVLESKPNCGTTVTLIIDHYDQLPCTEENIRDNRIK